MRIDPANARHDVFKALPFGFKANGTTAGRAAGASQTKNTGRPKASAAAPDDPHAIGAEGWLTAYDVKKSYRKRMVVKGVSLAVGRGESVGLLGPNGAGKTTVFYMITGLVPADDGRITIDGVNVTPLPMYQRARLGIGYLPQEASIFRGLTVEQNIMAVLELVEPDKKKRKEQLLRARDTMRRTPTLRMRCALRARYDPPARPRPAR